jgi:fumarate reductase flavoprotein subunit
MLTNVSGKKILVENDKVIGLEGVDVEGNPFTIKTKAVIIASGGFSNSDELIAKWTRFNPELTGSATAYLHKVGEGILMGMELGADVRGFGLMTFQSTPGEGNEMQEMGAVMAAAGGPGLWVNTHGKRFVDETVSFDFPMAANAIYSQRFSFVWSIWDEDWCTYLKEKGLDLGIGTNIPVGTKFDVMEDVLKSLEEGSPHVFMQDTVEDLADDIGVDPDTLQETIDRYNGFVEKRYDEDFFKDWRFMRPVGKGKLIAARLGVGHFISIGGLRVTPETEVINAMGEPVAEGVYACGADVGGLWGDTYEVRRAGAMMSWASTSGRIAGANAAALAKKKK